MIEIMPLLSFAFLMAIASISPGPALAVVLQYALTQARPQALLASLGIACSLSTQAIACVLGLTILLDACPRLMIVAQVVGAIYLAYLGLRALLCKASSKTTNENLVRGAFIDGYLVNLINPQALLFLFSMFKQFITPDMAWLTKTLFVIIAGTVAFIWYAIVSCVFTHKYFYPYFQRNQPLLLRLTGASLVGLAGFMLYRTFLDF